MAITNKDYIVFTLGALIGAGVAYFITKRSVQRQCYEDFMSTREDDEEAAEGDIYNGAKIVTIDKEKRFNNYTEKLEEKREEARKMAANLEYTVEKDEFAPYVIDAAEYASGLDGYSNMRINWYPSVAKATNEVDDEEVFELETLVGMANLHTIENEGNSFGYVRNDKKKLDIEVFVCYADWPLVDDGPGDDD